MYINKVMVNRQKWEGDGRVNRITLLCLPPFIHRHLSPEIVIWEGKLDVGLFWLMVMGY